MYMTASVGTKFAKVCFSEKNVSEYTSSLPVVMAELRNSCCSGAKNSRSGSSI